jgi:hypothetical protein
MRLVRMRRIPVLLAVIWMVVSPCAAQDIAASDWVNESFDEYKPGRMYGQWNWRTEDWTLNAQSHEIVDGVSCGSEKGKSVGIVATNGFHSRLGLTPKTCGTFTCSFDYKPADGTWTFVGFKTPQAGWDQFQVPIRMAPPHAGGEIQTCKEGKFVSISDKPLQVNQWYRFEITIRPGSDEDRPGTFDVKVAGPEGTVAEAAGLTFAADAKQPVSMFEIRSIKWTDPKGKFNGYLDNLSIQPDPKQAKISIACDKFGHLYYHGRPVRVIASVKVGEDGFSGPVEISVTDGYGKTVFQNTQELTIPARKTMNRKVIVQANQLERYGLYTITLAVGKTDRLFARCTMGVIAPPVDDGDNFDSPFGMFHYPISSGESPNGKGEGPEDQAKVVEQMYDLGIRWLRCNMHWNDVEAEKGKFDWGLMGVLVDEAYKHKMHAFIEFAYTPRWASSGGPDANAVGSVDTGPMWSTVAPKDFGDWENFCRKTAERYKGRVKVYEVWNEPGAPRNGNSNGFWRDSSDNFIRLIQHARKAVKSVDPEAKIMVGGFRWLDMGRYFENFVERVFRGAINDIDIISFHHWCGGPQGTKIYDYKLLIRRYGLPVKPYWDSESSGSGTTSDNVKGIFWNLAQGCEKTFPFIYNLPRYRRASLVNPDYTPHAGTISFATMTRFLTGAQIEGPLDLGPCIRAVSFLRGDKERIVVAWCEAEGREMPAHLVGAERIMDWQGNPGPKVTDIHDLGIMKVILGNTPTYIFCNLDGLDLSMPKKKTVE